MFCTQCGTQLDQGKNFCKNCGARVSQATEATRRDEVSEGVAGAVDSIGSTPTLARQTGGNNRLIIGAAGVAVIVLAATGVYFGTDLLKPSDSPAPPRVAEPITQSSEAPPLPSFEDTKDPGIAPDHSAASVNPPSPRTVETPKVPLESPPKLAPRADLPPAPTPSQVQRAGQDAPAPGRTAKAQPPVPASRGGAAAGIYETRRTTSVHEEPSASAKTVASISQGTRVTVVSSSGDWLEVHSKRGNPPGFIRRDDAAFIEKSN